MIKYKKIWISVVIIAVIVFISSFSVYGVLHLRRWKGVYYGESNGVSCELLCCNDIYSSLKQYFHLKTFHNEVYYLEGWVKLDKNLGKIYDVNIEGGDPCVNAFSGGPGGDPLPTGKWIKSGFGYAVFEKKTDVSNLKGIQVEVSFFTPPDKKHLLAKHYLSIQLRKITNPPILPPCKPAPHSQANPYP